MIEDLMVEIEKAYIGSLGKISYDVDGQKMPFNEFRSSLIEDYLKLFERVKPEVLKKEVPWFLGKNYEIKDGKIQPINLKEF